MPRYAAMRRRAAVCDPPDEWAWDMREQAPQTTVHEAEDGPVETGLFDAYGVPIYRLSERQPIGFRVKR